MALGKLQESAFWGNVRFSSYMSRIWLPVKERWARCYRAELNINVHTNNGLERLHQSFKRSYLKGKTQTTLSRTVNSLIEQFFPDKYRSYVAENQAMIGTFSRINPDIPDFLHKRPTHVIKTCFEMMEMSKEIPETDIVRNDEGYFSVGKHSVFLGDTKQFAKCSCFAWGKNMLPCKHMFSILRSGDSYNWDALGSSVRESPFLNVDYANAGNRMCPLLYQRNISGEN
ncbi:uncharacterized protein LOC127881126 [Dreissena polymorpha]|uniref:uncharacterized protein LOC127881126 n=1 Tax=Dreissena polymorpha TaxID=45954 RepID=UPI0022654A04|nr:uncharacterized protein LOC127881126 [Dreissena polymorpha]